MTKKLSPGAIKGTIYFMDNYRTVAKTVAAQVLIGEDLKADFSAELSYLFGLLRRCMMLDTNLYTQADVSALLSGVFTKEVILKSFDALPKAIPEQYSTPEFVQFLETNINHFKGIFDQN